MMMSHSKPPAALQYLGTDLFGLRFPYNHDVIQKLKQLPGCHWNGNAKLWQLPRDLLVAASEVLSFPAQKWQGLQIHDASIDTHAIPYQSQGSFHILDYNTFMLNYEMGLGKTAATIWALRAIFRRSGEEYVLITCPASVRENWRRELDKWWPEHPSAHIVRTGTDWQGIEGEEGPKIVITSYELLNSDLFPAHTGWTRVILDEIHYIKEGRAQRAKAVAAVRTQNPNSGFIGLSGTPITNEPSDLWHQLDVLWPGRFGSYTKFCDRYCGRLEEPHSPRGYVYKGISVEHAEELKYRLGFVSQRVTKLEVAHLLPAMTVSTRYVKQRHLKGLDELKRESLEGYHLAAAGTKIEATLNILDEARASGQSKFVVLTHLKATASAMGEALRARGLSVEVVTGDTPEKERYEAFDRVKDSPTPAALVATMHSVGIGIDLTFAQTVVFAELYWSPAVVLQALGRFQRLSGKHNVAVYFCVMEGTLEEAVGRYLAQKIEAIGRVIAPGAAETATSGVVKAREETEDEMLAAIALLAEELT